MDSISIRTKLLFCFLFLGSTLVALVGWMGYTTGKSALTHASFESLKSIREMKKRQIERYFEHLKQKCFMLASQDATIEAMKLLKKAFYTVKDELKITKEQLDQYRQALAAYYQEELLKKINIFYPDNPLTFDDLAPRNDNALILQYLYLVKYKAKNMSEEQLRCIAAGSTYSKIYAHYAPLMREYSKRMQVYDVYLFDLETGYSVLETAGEISFANSIVDGGLKQTNLAQAIEYIRTIKDKDRYKIVDFQFYNPSLGAPASFIAVPIFDGDKKIGALALELSVDEINSIMTDNRKWKDIGLGATGESYLIGNDYKMRSISRLLVENPAEYFKVLAALGTDQITLDRIKLYNTSILLQDITTVPAEAALRGESDVKIASDYRGVQVLAAYASVVIPDVHWGIVSKIDAREALAPVANLATRALWVALIALVLLSILTIPFTRWILRPIRRLNYRVQQALAHKLQHTDDLQEHTVGDIGILSRSIAQLYEQKITLLDRMRIITQNLEPAFQRMQQELATFAQLQENIPGISQIYDTVLLFDQAIEQSHEYKQECIKTIVYTKKLVAELIDTVHKYSALQYNQEPNREPDQQGYMQKLSEIVFTLEQLADYLQSVQASATASDSAQEKALERKQELVTQVQVVQEKVQEIKNQSKCLANLTHTSEIIIADLKDLIN